MQVPPAIIIVNSDLNDISKSTLQKQLYINQTITGDQFNDVIAADPTFPDQIHLNNARVLVISNNFSDNSNFHHADVIIFVKQGLAAILKNNLGPPDLTLPIDRLNIFALLRGNNSQYVVILPELPCGPKFTCGCFCHPRQNGFRGIVGIEWHANDMTGVHRPNCDNESNNQAFINRK